METTVQQPTLEGLNWYSSLVEDNPFSLLRKENVQGKVILQRERKGEMSDRQFAALKLSEFLLLYTKTPRPKSYFEIIRENNPQKPYFDIDINLEEILQLEMSIEKDVLEDIMTGVKKGQLSPEENELIQEVLDIRADCVMKALIHAIQLEFKGKGYNVEPKNISVFNSNCPWKRSYHVVVNNFYFKTTTENKYFHHQIIKRLLFGKQYVDNTVYKKTQAFRLYSSCKENTDRYKVLDNKYNGYKPDHDTLKFSENPDENREIKILYNSLITGVNKTMTEIKYKWPTDTVVEQKKRTKNKQIFSLEEPGITNERYSNVQEMFNRSNLKDFFILNGFNENGPIRLKRKKPMYCEICKREHNNDNAFIYYKNDQPYFDCHRNTEDKPAILLLNFLNK